MAKKQWMSFMDTPNAICLAFIPNNYTLGNFIIKTYTIKLMTEHHQSQNEKRQFSIITLRFRAWEISLTTCRVCEQLHTSDGCKTDYGTRKFSYTHVDVQSWLLHVYNTKLYDNLLKAPSKSVIQNI